MTSTQQVTATFVRLVTVDVGITSSGTVSSSPAGISCPGVCSASFTSGTNLTLTATPSSNNVFVGWTGPCAGSQDPTCTLALAQDQQVGATFQHVTARLSVSMSGRGTAALLSTPSGILCELPSQSRDTCSASFDVGTPVTLSIPAAPDLVHVQWGGACKGNQKTCSITLDQDERVTVRLIPLVGLEVDPIGDGAASSVTSDPAGIDCQIGTACVAGFEQNSTVKLTAAPGPNAVFAGWSGACSSSEPTCTVEMSGDRRVFARFNARVVTVDVSVSGGGSVTDDAGLIACPQKCSAVYRMGSSVKLTARIGDGAVFNGWGGACTGLSASCGLTLNADQKVTASFVFPDVTSVGTSVLATPAPPAAATPTPSGTSVLAPPFAATGLVPAPTAPSPTPAPTLAPAAPSAGSTVDPASSTPVPTVAATVAPTAEPAPSPPAATVTPPSPTTAPAPTPTTAPAPTVHAVATISVPPAPVAPLPPPPPGDPIVVAPVP
jgi:hypothetical protein